MQRLWLRKVHMDSERVLDKEQRVEVLLCGVRRAELGNEVNIAGGGLFAA